jgi:ABC-2 type transport system permease protein
VTDGTPRRGFSSSPLWQLTIARFKEFYREPIAIFWVYGFPLVLAIILGTAFRNRPVEKIPVVVTGPATTLTDAFATDPRLVVETLPDAEARNKLRTAKAAIVVVPTAEAPGYSFVYDPNRPDSVLAKAAVESILLRKANPNAAVAKEETPDEPGGRYIDFLIPGLLGANIMGGGLWGVGFVIVDMRIKKLLKRLLSTPMRKADFLWSLMIGRIVFTIAEVCLFLGFAALVFSIPVRGNLIALGTLIALGSVCFAGFGLLVASRAKNMETAQGLMNLVILPSYLFSGVFFNSANFPDAMQPVLQILPLTALNNGLRAVINDGAGFGGIALPSLILIVWTGVCYAIGAKLFRWL